MINLTGIKQIYPVNMTNNNIPSKQELNKPVTDTISFASKGRNYTDKAKKIMQAIREAAIKLKLPDFYTGIRFKKGDKITIEHLIIHAEEERAAKRGVKSINGIGNLVPELDDINNKRGKIPLSDWYKLHPEYLENSKKALRAYEQVNFRKGQLFEDSPEIDGKMWVKTLKKILNQEIGYIAFTGKKSQRNQKLYYIA